MCLRLVNKMQVEACRMDSEGKLFISDIIKHAHLDYPLSFIPFRKCDPWKSILQTGIVGTKVHALRMVKQKERRAMILDHIFDISKFTCDIRKL